MIRGMNSLKACFPGKRQIFRDEGYRGPLVSTRYFEGWYLRHVSFDKSRSLAVIAGLSLAPDPHAFIQLLYGPDSRVVKVRYSLEELKARRDRFELILGNNHFSPRGMVLDIDNGIDKICGSLEYHNVSAYPSTVVSPGIMGPFSWLPFMECIHGLISMDHGLSGQILWNGENLDFSNGRGYIEKDRGRSMPEQWVWVQTNQFENPGDSLMFSLAGIPWMGRSFNGHLGFLRLNGTLNKFGTYTGSRVSGRRAEGHMELQIRNKQLTLLLDLDWEGKGGSLYAPVQGVMNREIIEMPHSILKATLTKDRKILWKGRAEPAAAEVVGDLSKIL